MLTNPCKLILVVLGLVVVLLPGTAAAQSSVPTLDALSRADWRSSEATQPVPRDRSGDSLKNGALVGAVVGAAVLGGFAAIVCKVQQEPQGPSCGPDTLRLAALGAAIGAAGGVAIDAALADRRGVRLAVRVRF